MIQAVTLTFLEPNTGNSAKAPGFLGTPLLNQSSVPLWFVGAFKKMCEMLGNRLILRLYLNGCSGADKSLKSQSSPNQCTIFDNTPEFTAHSDLFVV